MKLAVCLCGIFIIWATSLDARDGERLTMRVSPSVAIAPADLVVRTTVEASVANRAMEIIAESDDFYRSSELPLDGGNAPKSNEFQFRSLPGGAYVVTAVLKGIDEQPIAAVRQQVRVVESPLAR